MKRHTLYRSYPDTALVSLLKLGDHEAFSEIFNRFDTALYRHAYKLLTNADLCNDVVQEVFLTLWDKREALHITGPLSAYLHRAIRNKVLDVISHEQVAEKYIESIRQFADRGLWITDEAVREKELMAIIEAEKAKLPPRMREIYELNREYDLSYREIGEQLAISEKTVKKQVHNALRVIRLKLSSLLSLLLF